MATIRKRGTSWQAQVRRDGYPQISKSFSTKADALSWAREKERAIERAELPVGVRQATSITVGDLLRRYEEVITPAKRGARFERSRIKTLLSHQLARAPLAKLSPALVARYRDDRLEVVSGDSVRRELTILRHCLTVAMREWDVPLSTNPVQSITLPEPSRARDQRLEAEAGQKLHAAIGSAHAWYLRPLMELAVETGMRRGELLSLQWHHVSLEKRTAHLPITKNGHARTVALTPKAIEVLKALPRGDARVFPVSGNAVRLAWERLRKRAGVPGLRFHDLRHEAVSRFFEAGLSIPEVALMSGHRDTRMLMRYTHLRPEALAEKLARVSLGQT
ncbi:tyrosine-type recombinase/integrase [Methylobacterium oxalidis]|uniref:Integrase n=1 Tax=Methylobacterium oxalidis TaxID=944322 RepID=A0A512JC56_9HYPH|nr:site-specific integrase [Methylobacterium oxalidis]GEP07537.1 integrase [Methylobacterium oxalidis]GLS65757.1 integrase [Methylobacterium oxalidis]